MFISLELKEFLQSINRNAPLNDGYKYPYKPALIISIFNYCKEQNISVFDNDICLNNDSILKEYYNLIVSDVILYDILNLQKSQKFNIKLGFNEKIKKQILNHILEMPANKLTNQNKIWVLNKKTKSIKIKINEISMNLNSQELSKYIYDYSCEVFKKCVPSYKDFKNNEIENFDYYIDSQIYEESSDKITEVKIRQYQHTFAKRVKDRDKKCLICCEQTPELLQACHIKPYNECVNNIEKYNIDNGITLCANHHILFDKHKFTFNLDWTIKISTNLYTEDTYMRIKEFEECYEILKNSKTSNINKFLEYRNKNYPIL